MSLADLLDDLPIPIIQAPMVGASFASVTVTVMVPVADSGGTPLSITLNVTE